jgi:hypothetical protein
MARKKDFEKKFSHDIYCDPDLTIKYGSIWKKIDDNRKEASKYAKEIFALTISPLYSPRYLLMARDLVNLAEQLKLDEDKRGENFKGEKLDKYIENIFPSNFNKNLEDKKLLLQLNVLLNNLPQNDNSLQILTGGKSGIDEVNNLLAKSKITSKEKVIALAQSSADEILASDDPFIKFVLSSRERLREMETKNKNLEDADVINNQLLGEALYQVYGDAIPPDATGTLRISDGIIKGYDYNGTRAPYKTTFYGSLDRYYSFR